MNRTELKQLELKQLAQEKLMQGAQTAFACLDPDADESEELRAEMDAQMTRIEKLFGYNPGSFGRGC